MGIVRSLQGFASHVDPTTLFLILACWPGSRLGDMRDPACGLQRL
jgi:hypothetical protein